MPKYLNEQTGQVWDSETGQITDQPTDFSLSEMVSNIPSSAKQFATDIVQPILHPVETAKSLQQLGQGVVAKAFPTEIEGVEFGPTQAEETADMVGNFIKERYGSVDKFKQTVMEDPVGVLADASMVLTGGGALAAKVPGMVGKVGGAIQKAGMTAEPVSMAKNIAATAAGKVLPATLPHKMYESAAKFGTAMPRGKRAQITETALKHRIKPTPAGLEKLDDMINVVDTEINALINTATQAGKTIPRAAIFRHLKKARKQVGGVKVDARKNLKQIDKVAKELDLHLKQTGKTHLTPDELQVLKQDAYKSIKFEASQFKSKKGADEAKKSIARSAKEEIEKVADVRDLNRLYGELLELKDPLTRSTSRIENLNLIGLGAPLKVGAGTVAGGPVGAAAGMGLSLLDMPKVKTGMAVKLKELQDAGLLGLIQGKPMLPMAMQGLLQSGRLQDTRNQ